MDKLQKKMMKLEKKFINNPHATITNAKILKRVAKIQAKIDDRRAK